MATGSNYDQSYQKSALAHNQAGSSRALSFYSGHYQGTKYAFTESFKSGAMVGAGLGLLSAVYYRRVSLIPKYSLFVGGSFGTTMAIS